MARVLARWCFDRHPPAPTSLGCCFADRRPTVHRELGTLPRDDERWPCRRNDELDASALPDGVRIATTRLWLCHGSRGWRPDVAAARGQLGRRCADGGRPRGEEGNGSREGDPFQLRDTARAPALADSCDARSDPSLVALALAPLVQMVLGSSKAPRPS